MRWLSIAMFAAFASTALAMPRPRPARPAVPEDAFRRAISRLEVGAPITYKNLTIFPVKGTDQTTREYVTLDQALSKGFLEVTEVGSGRVNEVLVRNKSDQYVFMMAGEVIVGAKQDRMLSDDVLVPPRSGRLLVRVYCTERGRWSGPTTAFGTGGFGGFVSLRAGARQTESQSYVWMRIRQKRDQLAPAGAPTEALAAVRESESVQKRLQPYRESKLGAVPELAKDTLGVVVYVGGKVKAADVFGRRDLLERLWPKLLEAYAMDAIDAKENGAKVGTAEARSFLQQAVRASTSRKDTPGAGDLLSLRSSAVAGQALLHDGALVHLELFPRGEEPPEYRRVPQVPERIIIPRPPRAPALPRRLPRLR